MATKPAPATRPQPAAPRDPTAPNLAATLDKLRGAIERLTAGTALGSPGSALTGGGAGTSGSVGLGIDPLTSARLGLAPVQAVARQVQQSLAGTAAAFTASMNQTQQSWRRNIGGFAGDFFEALRGQTRRRKGRGIAAGRATRRAYRAALDLARHQIKTTRRRAQSWARATRGLTDRFAGLGRRPGRSPNRRRSARPRRRGRSPLIRQIGQFVSSLSRWRTRTTRSWTRSATRMATRTQRRAQSWSKSTQRRARSWGTRASRGWRQARRSAGRWAASTRRRWRSAGRSTRRWARAHWRPLQTAGRRFGRRFATARRRANRTFARTRSPGKAFRAGAKVVAGRSVTQVLGSIASSGVVLGLVKELSHAVRQISEGQVARNAHLARYSPELMMATHQLGLGDMSRNLRMARETGGSAATLVNLTNRSRDFQASLDRLGAGINNRTASATAVLWNAMAQPWALGADALLGQMNNFDPKGKLLPQIAAMPFSTAAGIGGFVGSFLGGNFSLKEAADAATRAFDAQQQAQLAGKPPELDPWAGYITGKAPNLAPMRPMREVKF